MFIIVVGCGRLGSALARSLSQAGHRVTVIDWNPARFERIADLTDVAQHLGTGIDVDVLRAAGAAECDALLAVTDHDNSNIMIAQTAEQIFHVRQVVARVNDPRTEPLLQAFGIKSVCPTKLAADSLFEMLHWEWDEEQSRSR
jgi:trk system potassium uptake protein TrkA